MACSQALHQQDCLNLNIFAPASATPTSKLPVMIFFHGGYGCALPRSSLVSTTATATQPTHLIDPFTCSAFVEGSDQGPFHMYDGGYIAGTKPVIVVTSNYRLSTLAVATLGVVLQQAPLSVSVDPRVRHQVHLDGL